MLNNTVNCNIALQGTKIPSIWKTSGKKLSISNAFPPKSHLEPNLIPPDCIFLCNQVNMSGRGISAGKHKSVKQRGLFSKLQRTQI